MNERMKRILCRLGDLEHRILELEEGDKDKPEDAADAAKDMMSTRRWGPAAWRDLVDRVSSLEVSQRETEDIRALAAERITTGHAHQDANDAMARSMVRATHRMRNRRRARPQHT